ncbi:MAG: DMT family transporter, partial [Propionibacteriaceae bacterium]|nr:DMT family transporter [Propionibacteriaceae bacterium]
MRRSSTATLVVVAISAIWGSTFFIIKDAVGRIDPVDFLAVRFAIGAAIPAVIFHRRLLRLGRRQWLMGLALGVIFGLAQIAQTIGLAHTDASVSGFITGTHVIITPLLLWLMFRARLAGGTWVAVALAVVGLGVLSLRGMAAGGVGELLTLLGAALYAVHIIFLDRWSRSSDAMSLTVVQLIGIALTVGVGAAPGGYEMPPDGVVWGAVLYTAIAAGIVTMLAQTWAQRFITPTRIALLFTLEPVFASVFAV